MGPSSRQKLKIERSKMRSKIGDQKTHAGNSGRARPGLGRDPPRPIKSQFSATARLQLQPKPEPEPEPEPEPAAVAQAQAQAQAQAAAVA